jgi:hypothetical protein
MRAMVFPWFVKRSLIAVNDKGIAPMETYRRESTVNNMMMLP